MSHKSLILESALLACAVSVTLAMTLVSPGGHKERPTFTPAVLGGQPPGAVVLAGEDKDLAVSLAVAPQPGKLLLVTTVLGQDGAGVPDLNVSFAVKDRGGSTQSASAVPCAPGCYTSTVPAPAEPQEVRVAVDGPGAATAPLTFELPKAWPPRPALPLVRKAESEYRRLTTLVTREHLASDPTHALQTTYRAAAPDRLQLHTRGGAAAILIGKTRWDRRPGQPWRRSKQTTTNPIKPYWTPQIEDATLLGSATINGRPTSIVSFANPAIPAWFTIWIDKRTSRTLQLRMTASAHFMLHRYGPFNAPITISPPG